MYKKSDRIALFISVLLHSLLVFFPQQEEPRPLDVSSTLTESISVVELPTLPESESQLDPPVLPVPPVSPEPPDPPVLPAPPIPPAPAAPPAPPVATPVDPPAGLPPEASSTETSDRPIEQPMSDADPDADLPPQTPNTETSDSSTEQPEPAPDPDLPPEDPNTEANDDSIDEAQIAADWENWVGHLQSQNQGFESFPLLDIFNFFGEAGQVNQFFNENNQPKLDVSSFYLFPEQTPEQVLQTVVIPELTSNTGFELQPQENVSAGLAYQLSQGEMRRYLIIVQLNERSGSVLMLSDSLLGLES